MEKKAPGNAALLGSLSIIEEGQPKYVRMAHLAVIGSHAVNGVAALHSQLIKETVSRACVTSSRPPPRVDGPIIRF